MWACELGSAQGLWPQSSPRKGGTGLRSERRGPVKDKRPGQGSSPLQVGLSSSVGTWEVRGRKESYRPEQWPPERHLGVMGDDPILKAISYRPQAGLDP